MNNSVLMMDLVSVGLIITMALLPGLIQLAKNQRNAN